MVSIGLCADECLWYMHIPQRTRTSFALFKRRLIANVVNHAPTMHTQKPGSSTGLDEVPMGIPSTIE